MLRFSLHLLALALGFAAAHPPQGPRSSAGDLVGVWRVDLRPTPDAEPYFQTFEVESVEGNRLAGSFYGAKIGKGHTNVDWGRIHFAFVTSDGSGEYHTAGELVDGKLRGTTLSIGRGFLAVWTAERTDDSNARQ